MIPSILTITYNILITTNYGLQLSMIHASDSGLLIRVSNLSLNYIKLFSAYTHLSLQLLPHRLLLYYLLFPICHSFGPLFKEKGQGIKRTRPDDTDREETYIYIYIPYIMSSLDSTFLPIYLFQRECPLHIT